MDITDEKMSFYCADGEVNSSAAQQHSSLPFSAATLSLRRRRRVMLFRQSRQGTGRTPWHFCRNCSSWPEEDYEEETMEPRQDLICTECTRKLTDLQCESGPAEGAS
jgi:hypothetical protein